MSNVNIPLLRKAVEWVEAEAQKPQAERQWLQRYWRLDNRGSDYRYALPEEQLQVDTCGTTFCVAGYISQLIDERYTASSRVDNIHASRFAAKALGIYATNFPSPGHLFYEGNTAEDVRRIAEQLAGERL